MPTELSDDEVFGAQEDDALTTGSTPSQELSDEDVFGPAGDSAPPVQAGPQDELSDEDVFGDSASARISPSPDTYTQSGSAAMGAVKGAAPGLGGMAAGIATGAALGTLGLGPVGTVLGGLAGGFGAGALISKGQDWFLDQMGLNEPFQQAERDNPLSYTAGNMAPALLALRPGLGQVQAGARAVSGALGGGIEAGVQAMGDEPMDPRKIAMGVGAGAAFPNINRMGNQFERIGERIGNKLFRGANGRYRGGNANPDLKPEAPPAADEIEVVNIAEDQPSVAGGVALEQPPAPNIEAAGNPGQAPMAARTASRPSEPGRNYQKDSAVESDLFADEAGPASQAVVQKDGPVTPDVAQALGTPKPEKGEAPQARQPEQAEVPSPDAGPTSPDPSEVQMLKDSGLSPEEIAQILGPQPEKPVFNELPPDRSPQAGQSDLSALGTHEGPLPQPRVQSDGLEGARMQREALEGVQRKQAASQQGEDFKNLPEREAPAVQPNNVPAREQVPERPAGLFTNVTHLLRQRGINHANPKPEIIPPHTEAPNAVPRAEPVPAREQAPPAGEVIELDRRARAPKPKAPEPKAEAPKQNAEGSLPLTPAELKSLHEDRAILKAAGWDRALAKLDTLSPQKQRDILRVASNQIRSEHGVPERKEVRRPGAANTRLETRAKTVTGAIPGSKALAERNDKAIKFAMDSHAEFGPEGKLKDLDLLEPSKLQENRQRIKDAWAEIMKRNGGVDPTVRSKTQYVPLKQGGEHAEAYQWLKALKQSATNQNHQNFAMLHTTKGMGTLARETGKVEGDIAHRPQLPEAAEQAETATNLAHDTARKPMEDWHDPDQMESRVFGVQQENIRSWINNLDDVDYRLLKDMHPDLETNVRTTQDPKELRINLQDDLLEAQKRTPKGEITSEVDLPAKKLNIPNLPARPEPKPAGRSLAKDSEEFKTLAAKYAADANAQKGAKPRDTNARLASELEASTRPEERPVDGTSSAAVLDKIKSFASDESGSVKIPAWVQSLFTPTPANTPPTVTNPGTLPGPKEYAADLTNNKFRMLGAQQINKDTEIRANFIAAPELTPYKWRKIALAEQEKDLASLPADLKKVYDDFVAPVAAEMKQAIKDLKDLNDQKKLGLDIPALVTGLGAEYQPRYTKGKQFWDHDETDRFDPFTGKGLGSWSPNAQRRDWFALQDVGNTPGVSNRTGPRMVVKIDGDASKGFEAMIFRPGQQPQKLKNLPASFNGEVGNTLPLKIKGKQSNWQVDHATTEEIEKGTNGTVQFHENPLVAWSKALSDTNKALEQAKLKVAILEDPRFQAMTTTSMEEAKARGYHEKPTDMPEFNNKKGHPIYMPKELVWAFDDFHKPGFGGTKLDKLRNFNTAVMKVFNTNAPLVHVMNELDLFVIDRGFKWLNPKATYELVRSAPQAFKSVNSQDPLQREMRNAGANPMLASVFIRNTFPEAAKKFSLDISKNPSKWDPIAKVWNTTTPELARKAYDLSSDITWRLSDYLTTMRYLEEKRSGKTPEEAAARVNKFMSDYHIGPTVVGSRNIQQVLTDPAFTMFGRYKYGVFRSLAHMTKDLVGKGKTPAQRTEALGQLMTMAVLGYMVYPALDKGVQAITGNDEATVRRRGASAFPHALTEIGQGERGFNSAVAHTWTPSPLLQGALELKGNKDFSGKDIIPQGEWPGVIPDAVANLSEYAAKTLVPPYGTISQGYARPEGGLGEGLKGLAWDQVGVGLPSEAGAKRIQTQEKWNNRAAKQREKKPSGIIPDVMNRFTK